MFHFQVNGLVVLVSLIFFAGPLVLYECLEESRDDPYVVLTLPRRVQSTVFLLLFFIILMFGDMAKNEFIYFQF